MYTDDPLAIVVGVGRAMRLLEAWHRVTSQINLTMAGADKRQLGGHAEWIGESREGQNAIVRPDRLMMQKLEAWLHVLGECAGAMCTITFTQDAPTKFRSARLLFSISSDAAGDGEGSPGIVEYMHGFYWRVPLHENLLHLLHITAWETLATAVSILLANRLVGAGATLSINADAAMTPYEVAHQTSKSEDVRTIMQVLLQLPEYRQATDHLVVET
ncbi:MAG: hypothetical protein SGPRY_005290 [Prymnesium sp.]